jgi:hypothetical protein
VERFNRTLLDEWAYVRVYRSETARTAALARWLHLYNHHRAHTSLGGHAPITRVETHTALACPSTGSEESVHNDGSSTQRRSAPPAWTVFARFEEHVEPLRT